MEMVHTCENIVNANHIKNLLNAAKIDVIIKNSAIQGAVGEVPPMAAWPEVWVLDPASVEQAKKIIADIEEDSEVQSWQCSSCDETNEGNFNLCWNCSEPK
ncbi:MAG: DUF2007 domain-containing protein [Kangiellaceae bacterium]|nr:DUF2007 domain-containing protein [Kangiellaceae bacterium]MCW8997624.1 DUF2007 domain-containing protein [Kangiellaceae bacterium]MCW9016269.1 DUF2007 domain-containing protein [Kangiellaceae bacterium]